jgi:hypothetical protein
MRLPPLHRLRQTYANRPAVDIPATISSEFEKLTERIRPGQSIAIGVGSRGITSILEIVHSVIGELKSRGAVPFLVPAMGSHGGATPDGQLEVLASYGMTPETMGVEIRPSLEVIETGVTDDGIVAYCSVEALRADGVILVNRIKPHTDFFGSLGSGLMKMSVIGLGKHRGAIAMHLGATQFGYERVIRSLARINLEKAPVLGGLAILEDAQHQIAKLVVLPKEQIEAEENKLFFEAKALMPQLPFEEVDLLIVDQIGKNISGSGMDPNIINRSIHGYSSLPVRGEHTAPFIKRIFVRGITPETHGNAIGIGIADATTTRLTQEMDRTKTEVNALTSLTVQSCKIPITFDNDQLAIETMIRSLPLASSDEARIVRIRDTLSIARMDISEKLWQEVSDRKGLSYLSGPCSFDFDGQGNLFPMDL